MGGLTCHTQGILTADRANKDKTVGIKSVLDQARPIGLARFRVEKALPDPDQMFAPHGPGRQGQTEPCGSGCIGEVFSKHLMQTASGQAAPQMAVHGRHTQAEKPGITRPRAPAKGRQLLTKGDQGIGHG
jgi:hypothetical protein